MKPIKDYVSWWFASQECSVVSTHFGTRWACFHMFSQKRVWLLSMWVGGRDTHVHRTPTRSTWPSGLTLTRESVPLSGSSGVQTADTTFPFRSSCVLTHTFQEKKNVSVKPFQAIRPATCLFHCEWAGLFVNTFTRASVCICGQICWPVQKSITDLFICWIFCWKYWGHMFTWK